ncbi:jg3231 [Pararge aegeria aegeria]|uniref:Jg3231 protein n=1 Tax=Pararge aegeria aegeria TaxID=348720 RepID=A0A8S4RVA6_9NEOP|nr:jg3231 [Pararge aegeria aegeria]
MSQSTTSSKGSKKASETVAVRKMETMRRKLLTRTMEEAQPSDTSDSDVPQANTSRSSRASTGGASQHTLASLPAVANRLFQEAKDQLEQSSNLKQAIREKVLDNLAAIYEIVLRLSESRQTLQLQLEKARLNTTEQLLCKEREYSGRLAELAKGVQTVDVRSPVNEILSEVKSLRQLIVFDVLDQLTNNNQQQQQYPHVAEVTKQLQEATKELTAITEENRKQATYAEIAASTKPKSVPALPSHSVIVSSTDVKDTSEDVLQKIRCAADARVTGVRVERVRKARNQKVIISCKSQDSLKQLTDKLKTNEKLKIEQAKNKDPMIVIKNVLSYNTDEDVVASIKIQNKDALKDIREEDFRTEVKYRRKARNPHECNVIMQVSPKVWQKLTALGQVHIDLQRCAVFDQSPLVQCTRCLGFGHGRKVCKETVDRCSHCAGPHLKVNCPSWTVGDLACCRNCHVAKLVQTEHSAFNIECPTRKKWDIIARSSVAYC